MLAAERRSRSPRSRRTTRCPATRPARPRFAQRASLPTPPRRPARSAERTGLGNHVDRMPAADEAAPVRDDGADGRRALRRSSCSNCSRTPDTRGVGRLNSPTSSSQRYAHSRAAVFESGLESGTKSTCRSEFDRKADRAHRCLQLRHRRARPLRSRPVPPGPAENPPCPGVLGRPLRPDGAAGTSTRPP